MLLNQPNNSALAASQASLVMQTFMAPYKKIKIKMHLHTVVMEVGMLQLICLFDRDYVQYIYCIVQTELRYYCAFH